MTIFVFVYNIFLIVLYSFTMTFSFVNFKRTKNKLFLFLFFLFLLFVIDNTIVYMTEFLETFANSYNHLFLDLPIVKALIFLGTQVLLLMVISHLNESPIKKYQFGILVCSFIWMMGIPFYTDYSLNTWLFYLPNQLFLIYLGSYSIYSSNQKSDKKNKIFLLFLGYLFIVFGFIILLEDSYVIFSLDQYTNLKLRIYNRNISEDIFSIIISTLTIYLSTLELSPQTTTNKKEQINDFFKDYELTVRELEVLQLILEHHNNQEIADILFLSIGTVKAHIHNIYVKLDIHRRSELFSLSKNLIQN